MGWFYESVVGSCPSLGSPPRVAAYHLEADVHWCFRRKMGWKISLTHRNFLAHHHFRTTPNSRASPDVISGEEERPGEKKTETTTKISPFPRLLSSWRVYCWNLLTGAASCSVFITSSSTVRDWDGNRPISHEIHFPASLAVTSNAGGCVTCVMFCEFCLVWGTQLM